MLRSKSPAGVTAMPHLLLPRRLVLLRVCLYLFQATSSNSLKSRIPSSIIAIFVSLVLLYLKRTERGDEEIEQGDSKSGLF